MFTKETEHRLIVRDDNQNYIGMVWDYGHGEYELDFARAAKLTSDELRSLSKALSNFVNRRIVGS